MRPITMIIEKTCCSVTRTLVDSSAGRNYTDHEQRPQHWLEEKNEALRIARDSLKAAQTHQAFYSDRGRTEVNYKVGDQVLVHRQFLITPEARYRPCDKLRPPWYGPFKVIKIITKNALQWELPHFVKSHPVFNVSALKKYHPKTKLRVVKLSLLHPSLTPTDLSVTLWKRFCHTARIVRD